MRGMPKNKLAAIQYEAGKINGYQILIIISVSRILSSQNGRMPGKCILHGRIDFVTQDYTVGITV